ncbi:MAG: hypothetical protein ACTS22_00420 [Phycisphaerales bacterium]
MSPLALPLLLIALTAGSAAPGQPEENDPTEPASAPAEEPPADPGPRTATVILHDGQVLTGELFAESPERVVLLINGVRTTIETRRIRESYIQPPVLDRYRTIRRTIADDDVDGLIQIAEWLIAKGRPDLAIPDLELALEADPFARRARELRLIALEAIRLRESRTTPAERDDNTTQPRTTPTCAEPADFPLITEADVNLIRVYEVDLDNPPRMTLERRHMEAVLDEFAGQPGVPGTAAGREALLDAPVAEQLATLFRLRAREHYHRVEIHEEPESLRRFRDDVFRTWLNNACATARCHGGAEAGRLRLARASRTDPKVYLTNLVILDRYKTEDGAPLIDYAAPASSRLLQAGLPRHVAEFPHPEVQGWRPVFRGINGGQFREAVDWIQSMYVPRPDYPIAYTPPTAMEPGEPEAREPR